LYVSTSIRNLGNILADSAIETQASLTGLSRATSDVDKKAAVLESNYVIMAPAVQAILRAAGSVDNPYKMTQEMTKGKELSQSDYLDWI
jgi:hypothetical protein